MTLVDNITDVIKEVAKDISATNKEVARSKGLLMIDGSLTFKQGGLSTVTGEEGGGILRVRTGFLKYNSLEVSVISTQKVGVWFYDENKQFVSFSGYRDSHSFDGNAGYVRISVRNDDDSPITPQSVSIQSLKVDYPSENLNRLGAKNEPNGLAGLDESGRLSDSAVARRVFPIGSSIENWRGYNPDQFISLEIWDREESDSFYLNTLYRHYYLPSIDNYGVSLGFKRVSDNRHISPSLPTPQTNPNTYAFWIVTEAPSGVQEYYLYVDGDDSNPPVGMVRVNWDLVPTGNIRFIGTDGLSPVITENLGKTVQKTKFIRSNEVLTNPFLGKKIVGLGDSITYGFIPRNVPEYPGLLDSWLPLTAGKLGMSYVNYGISGSTLGDLNNGTRSPFTGRYQTMDDDADVIVVMGGTNDVRSGIPLGAMSDRTPYTYYGALHVLCEGLIDKYQVQQGLTIGKEKIIFFMTPIKLLDPTTGGLDTDIEPYVEAVKDVCAYYSLPVFDSYNLSGINPHILQTVVGTEAGYTGNYNPYITDGTHPTQEGHQIMARNIAGFVRSLA